MNRNYKETDVAWLKKRVEWNARMLVASWLIFICITLCAFQASPQITRLHALRIVDDNGNDVIRIETVGGNPIIQMRTATLATTIESGTVKLDSKDASGNRATTSLDFFDTSPRLLMVQPGDKQTLALGFEKAEPAVVLRNVASDEFTTLQSGSLISQNSNSSRRIAIQLGDEAGPAVRIIDTEKQSDRLGVLTGDGVGAKVDGATVELRTVDGIQTMSINSADAKNSVSLTVDKDDASAKFIRQGKPVTWIPSKK